MNIIHASLRFFSYQKVLSQLNVISEHYYALMLSG